MRNQKGFTLVEIILTMGLFAVLAGFVTINLIRPQAKSSVDNITNSVVAEIKGQQLNTMYADAQGGTSASKYGVYFENNKYILFKGNSYVSADPDNLSYDLPQGVEFIAINLPSSQIIFDQLSGEVGNYDPGNNNIQVKHSAEGTVVTISINEYGRIEIN